MTRQCTIKTPTSVRGVGLHSGESVTLTLRPAPPNAGIVFQRVDFQPQVSIKVQATSIQETKLCSMLKHEGVHISTIEHIMSALMGCGVDNIYMDIDGAEVPILDGSSSPFVYLIDTAGIVEQEQLRQFIRIKKTIEVQDEDRFVMLEPYDNFFIDFSIDFPHPVFTHKRVVMDFSQAVYRDEVSRARTFGFMNEVEYLRANGLAKGGGVDNAIVMDEYTILNKEGLRYPDEFVRHKILDAIGDLYTLGHPLMGKLTAHKSGHALNNRLARKLIESPDCWEFAT